MKYENVGVVSLNLLVWKQNPATVENILLPPCFLDCQLAVS